MPGPTPAAKKDIKYIVITGGVLSGLGKGIATASIGCLLRSDLKIVPIKCDGYLNSDPGTINPIEHGEVFVLDDGSEVDMDFGHYERFIGVQAKGRWNITMGKIYRQILEQERQGKYLGKTVQLIPHVTEMIKENIYGIAESESADIVLIEVGGTIGDMEIELFVESVRQMASEVGRKNMMFIHLTYVPIPAHVNEPKSKPTQQSVRMLNQSGIYPDIIIGRCAAKLPLDFKRKISLHCNVDERAVISGIDADIVYEVPFMYRKEGLDTLIEEHFGLRRSSFLGEFERPAEALRKSFRTAKRTIQVGLCGKYTQLEDSYASIHEALMHVSAQLNVRVETRLIETSNLEDAEKALPETLKPFDAVVVPGGFGIRGMEGKVQVIRFVRERKIPFLGICLGMQLAVIEFARNVSGIGGATTREVEQEGVFVADAVVDLLEEQRHLSDKGATMRLGGHEVLLQGGSQAKQIYNGKERIRERFRHRYEINPKYVPDLESKGLVFSGKAKGRNLVQLFELPGHPFFIGSQFHPELISRLESPARLFAALIEAALQRD